MRGHPLEAVAWLANLSGAQHAQLNVGDLIMTGSVTPVILLDGVPCCVGTQFGDYGKTWIDLTRLSPDPDQVSSPLIF